MTLQIKYPLLKSFFPNAFLLITEASFVNFARLERERSVRLLREIVLDLTLLNELSHLSVWVYKMFCSNRSYYLLYNLDMRSSSTGTLSDPAVDSYHVSIWRQLYIIVIIDLFALLVMVIILRCIWWWWTSTNQLARFYPGFPEWFITMMI